MPTFEAPAARADALAPHVHESPVVMPSVHANPFMPPVHASPVEPAVHASPVEPAVHATAEAKVARASHIERPVYASPFEPREDVNPIVRPVVEERVHQSPVAPSGVEAARGANALEAPVAVEAPVVEPPPVVEAPVVVAAPVVVEAPVVVAPTVVVEAPVVERPLPVSDAHASETPAIEEPAAEPGVRANAFETAPTELAYSETPIDQAASADESVAEPHSASAATAEGALPTENRGGSEPATAEFAPSEAAAEASESVVAEGEIQEQAAIAQPFPGLAPARSFTSSGSEMPVVITTPAPYRRDSSAPSSNLFSLGRELLPRAQAWSKKTLRDNPRALVIAAPLVALLGIWAVRSAVSHPKHAALAEANAEAAAQPAAAPPAPIAPAAGPAAPASTTSEPERAAAPSSSPAADPSELASAVSHGLPALEALAHKFPSDPQVNIALASQQAQAQRFEAAVESVERVIEADAKSAESGKVMGILWRAAQSDASEQSFSALRKLGARGADIAFDLATTSGVRESVRERAKTELTQSLSSDASADTRVATALLLAPDCSARKSLLARAEREGGKRTRAMLERFSRAAACTSTTDKACNSCLTGSAELTHAVAQLSAGGKK